MYTPLVTRMSVKCQTRLLTEPRPFPGTHGCMAGVDRTLRQPGQNGSVSRRFEAVEMRLSYLTKLSTPNT